MIFYSLLPSHSTVVDHKKIFLIDRFCSVYGQAIAWHLLPMDRFFPTLRVPSVHSCYRQLQLLETDPQGERRVRAAAAAAEPRATAPGGRSRQQRRRATACDGQLLRRAGDRRAANLQGGHHVSVASRQVQLSVAPRPRPHPLMTFSIYICEFICFVA